jgi:hypothetical protein
MTTPYDLYVDLLSKQASDALIPGQVGMGVNSGHMDSDAVEATSSALAQNRANMQAMALISGSADAGAGYSTPAPGSSPSMQMQADVKAAAVVDEAIKFAEYVYMMNKQALTEEQRQFAINKMKENLSAPERGQYDANGNVIKRQPVSPKSLQQRQDAFLKEQEKQQVLQDMLEIRQEANKKVPGPQSHTPAVRSLGSQAADALWHNRSRLERAGIAGLGVAAAGGLGYGVHQMMQPAGDEVKAAAYLGQQFALRQMGLI